MKYIVVSQSVSFAYKAEQKNKGYGCQCLAVSLETVPQ